MWNYKCRRAYKYSHRNRYFPQMYAKCAKYAEYAVSMGRYRPMADGADSRADKESGTCPSGTDEPPGKATFNATLRCKIVAGQAAHKLADALPADKRKSGHGQQSVAPLAALAPQLPAHRAGLSPTAPRGHNRPGAAVPARASVPRIRVH